MVSPTIAITLHEMVHAIIHTIAIVEYIEIAGVTGFTTAETPAYFLDTAEYSAKVLGFAIQRDQRIKKENSKSTKLNKNEERK